MELAGWLWNNERYFKKSRNHTLLLVAFQLFNITFCGRPNQRIHYNRPIIITIICAWWWGSPTTISFSVDKQTRIDRCPKLDAIDIPLLLIFLFLFFSIHNKLLQVFGRKSTSQRWKCLVGQSKLNKTGHNTMWYRRWLNECNLRSNQVPTLWPHDWENVIHLILSFN